MAVLKLAPYDPSQHEVPALPSRAFAITKSDSNTFDTPVSVLITVAGATKVTPFNGDSAGAPTAITLPADVCVAGYVIPFRVSQVWSTGTDSTTVGIY